MKTNKYASHLSRQSKSTHPAVDDAAKNMQDAVKDLTHTLEEAASETGAVTGLIESISKAMNEVKNFYRFKLLIDYDDDLLMIFNDDFLDL